MALKYDSYPIPMTEWARKYNDTSMGYRIDLFINGVKTQFHFSTAKDAYDKFVSLENQHQFIESDFPGGSAGEYYMTWMPQKNGDGWISLVALFDPEIDQYRYNRCWQPPVISTFINQMNAVTGGRWFT